jgi:hypothetical protein
MNRPHDNSFRAEVPAWMAQHLRGEFDAAARPRRPRRSALTTPRWPSAGSSAGRGRLDRHRLAAREWAGAQLPLGQQVVFHEEYVRAGGPGRWATSARPCWRPR